MWTEETTCSTAPGCARTTLHYLDDVLAPAIAIVNMMSLFGLHRSLRGALVGHFAAAEITTGPSAHRMTQALAKLNADPRCAEFYAEHIEADAVHEQIMRRDVIGSLLEQEPSLKADVVFGIQATELLEARLSAHLLSWWEAAESSPRTRRRWLVSQTDSAYSAGHNRPRRLTCDADARTVPWTC